MHKKSIEASQKLKEEEDEDVDSADRSEGGGAGSPDTRTQDTAGDPEGRRSNGLALFDPEGRRSDSIALLRAKALTHTTAQVFRRLAVGSSERDGYTDYSASERDDVIAERHYYGSSFQDPRIDVTVVTAPTGTTADCTSDSDILDPGN